LASYDASTSSSGGPAIGGGSSGGGDDSAVINTGSDGATGVTDDAGSDATAYADGGADEVIPEDSGGAADSSGSPDSSATADAGANMCATKICVDPVFDCPLQGCFNGCTNFLCN
jgi:hypothetical protein